MNRAIIVIGLVAAAAGLAGYFVASQLRQPPAPPRPVNAAEVIGQPAPALAGEDPQGLPRELAAHYGQPLLVNFWATWCAPCRREMPALDALNAERPGDPVLGIAVDRAEDVRGFLEELAIDYPVLIVDELEGMRTMRRLGNAGGVMPFTVRLDAQGRVTASHFGELSQEQAAALLDAAEEAPTAAVTQ